MFCECSFCLVDTLLQQMETLLNHQEECRTAVRESRPPPPTPDREVIGDAETFMRHVKIGKKAMKGTEEEAVELRKMLYSGNTLFGGYHIWATLTPSDLYDAIVAAYAGFKCGPRNAAGADSSSALKGYHPDDMAEAIAKNPVACARGFRKQVEIYIKHILGWDLESGCSHEGIMSLVQAFTMQVTAYTLALCSIPI
jgi:hypothetical protein